MTRGFLSVDLPSPFERVERGTFTYDADTGQHVCSEHGETIVVVRAIEPTNSGSYYYECSVCRAGGWSGL